MGGTRDGYSCSASFQEKMEGYHRLVLRNRELVESWAMHGLRNQTEVIWRMPLFILLLLSDCITLP